MKLLEMRALTRVDHVQRVGAGLLADFQHHRRHAVQAGQRARLFDAVLDPGDVAGCEPACRSRLATMMSAKSRRPLDAAQRPQAHLAGALIHAAPGDLDVLRGQRAPHLVDVEVVGVQLLAVQPHLDLPRALADEPHLAHPVDAIRCSF